MSRRWELDESDLPTLRKLRALWRTAEKIERGWGARWTARVLAKYFEKTVERVEARSPKTAPDTSGRAVFAEASAAVRWALNGHGDVEPANSSEFYNYVARLVLNQAWTVEKT